ncbi:ferritin-like protein [Streptomyces sp. ET3-23]|uniref:ferritin-like domain-containing protein n=1 Tax=Streptomyces sp. ET3-23 TaxID=2885643 RepID=UPI001D111221|nr:ferritin-like protein [Streptomyces sp. ET3-23]MCC2276035.1 ferritin-like protein [Streptomyces sp. ET3-23]
MSTKAPVQEITTLPDLIAHLKAAAQVELSTVPLYLYATYTIKTRGYSQWAAGASAQRTLIGISIEEMLHLSLVRNLLIAVGDTDFRLYDENVIPTYPGPMLKREPELTLRLRKLSTDQVRNTFMQIEQPATPPGAALGAIEPYHSLGEFYARIERGIQTLRPVIDWAKAKKDLWKFQYHRAYWNQNGGSDHPLLIVDEASALQAMQVIVDQGEGAPEDKGLLPDPIVRTDDLPPQEIGKWQASHYMKFSDIAKGLDGIGVVVDDNGKQKYTIDDEDVIWPVLDDPDLRTVTADQPVKDLMEFSNAVYCYVLALLDAIYRTPMEALAPKDRDAFTDSVRYGYEQGFVASMQGLLYPVCDLLVRTPLVAGQPSVHAGPPFQYYAFETKNPKGELAALCEKLLGSFPALGGDDGVQRQIALLPDIELP